MEKSTSILVVLIAITITTNAQWNQQTSGTTTNLLGVSFVNQNLGFVCGDAGTILKTIDGGTNWLPQNSETAFQLSDLQFIDANIGYCTSWFEAGGKLLKTVNGGNNWNDISLNIPGAKCGGIWFFSADTGFLALGDNSFSNSKILKTVNGGTSWDTVYSGGAGWLSFFNFPDRNNGYATVSGSRVLKTTDGGNSWSLLTNISGSLWMSGVYFLDKNTGFVGGGDYNTGGGSILKTTNGGTDWQVLTNEYGISIMLFTTLNTGYAVGSKAGWSNEKKIIKTTDAGVSWTPETLAFGNMNDISFPNANIGYAVGGGGIILKINKEGTGIAENSVEDLFNIFPNPASDFVSLNINKEDYENVELYIYNVTGVLVKSDILKQNQQQINIEDLNNGIYMVAVKSKTNTKKQKLIIQR